MYQAEAIVSSLERLWLEEFLHFGIINVSDILVLNLIQSFGSGNSVQNCELNYSKYWDSDIMPIVFTAWVIKNWVYNFRINFNSG